MRPPLDSCSFLGLTWNEPDLSDTAKRDIAEPKNDVFLTAASVWEITLKHMAGRLEIRQPFDPATFHVQQRKAHGIDSLPIGEDAAAQLAKLPNLHRDRFARMLVCQAIAHGMMLVTPAQTIQRYTVLIFWQLASHDQIASIKRLKPSARRCGSLHGSSHRPRSTSLRSCSAVVSS